MIWVPDRRILRPQLVASPWRRRHYGGSSRGLTPTILAVVSYAPSADYTTFSGGIVAIDATNLKVTFTAPASGQIVVRLLCTWKINQNHAFFGLLSGGVQIGSTVMVGGDASAGATVFTNGQAPFFVTGLTAGNSYTFTWGWWVDAAATITIPGSTSQPNVGPMLMIVEPA